VLGFDAATIASAFLMSPAAMGQRLVRAKNKILEARIPFRIPGREEFRDRLDTVLDAIYAAFAEGWIDPAGTDIARRDLADEAIFLGRLVADLLAKTGARAEARQAYEIAIGLERDPTVRRFLQQRQAVLTH
jgi:RNA polymerase sigma-70 factor (ECF subfamily)